MSLFFRLVRWPNLLLLAMAQLLCHFLYFKYQYLPAALHGFPIFALVLATGCIAASGYIINNIHDRELDADYKPHVNPIGRGISEKQAYNLYFALTIVGVGVGFALANYIEKPIMAGLFIGASALLHLYASQYKSTPLIGNLIIAVLVALALLLVPIFNVWPYLQTGTRDAWSAIWLDQLVMACFAAVLTLFREWAKDMEDAEGDAAYGVTTLAVWLGTNRLSQIQALLQMAFALLLTWYSYVYLMQPGFYTSLAYVVATVIAPLMVLSIQLLKAQKSQDYQRISLGLKWVLCAGLISIYVVIYAK